jgi:hypothetical protein
MKKKTKTKTTENAQQQATFTPNNPTFVQPAIENLSTKISETFGAADPSKLAPGPTSLQTQALGGAAGLQTPAAFGDAETAIKQGLSGGPQSVDRVNIADSIASFMNPYMKDVVDTSLADFDFGAGVSRAQGQLARAGDETFGGSSGALQAALTEGELGSGRNLTNAGFREQALNRNIQGGTALGNLGATRGAEDRANVQTKFGLGEAQRQIEKEQGNASIDALLKQISAFSGLPLDILKGYTTSGTSSGTSTSNTKQSGATLSDWLGYFAANAAAAAKGAGGG